MKTAKFFQLNQVGAADALRISELSIPEPKTKEVRIKKVVILL